MDAAGNVLVADFNNAVTAKVEQMKEERKGDGEGEGDDEFETDAERALLERMISYENPQVLLN